jgi:hypothetical protein
MKKFFKKLDRFGQPISLSYKGSNTYKTFFGGALTVLFVSILVLLSLNSIISLFLRGKVLTSTTTLDNIEPLELQIPFDNNFFFAVGLYPDKLNNKTTKAFILTVDQRKWKRFPNGTRTEVRRKVITMEPCEKRHFPSNFDYVKMA